jgi:spore germination protein
MKKVGSNTITPGEVTFLLIGSMVGIGVLTLPNDLVETAKQDAWISAAIGAIYPLYMVIIASLLCKKHPQKNILALSKKCFGKLIGSILNIVFLFYFVLLATSIASGLGIILGTLIVDFLSLLKILIVTFILAAYTITKGLKVLARVNQLMFIYAVLLSLSLAVALSKGTYLNISPILGSGVLNIIKASKQSAFAYTGVAILFLIYPFMTDKTKIMKSSLLSVLITAIIYIWVTFITVYYLGIDIIPKTLWSVSFASKSVKIPVINNFRYIFLILWANVMFKSISNDYFAVVLILEDFFKKIKSKKIIYAIYPIMIYLSLKYENHAYRTDFLDFIIPKYTLFNIVYVTLIVLIIYLKKDNQNEE